MKFLRVLFAGLLSVVGCSKAKQEGVPTFNGPMIKISVLKTDKVLVDGKETTLSELDGTIADITKRRGLVLYYREGGEEDPSAFAEKVIDLVIKHGPDLMLSSKPDFSDSIDLDGKSHPNTGG